VVRSISPAWSTSMPTAFESTGLPLRVRLRWRDGRAL